MALSTTDFLKYLIASRLMTMDQVHAFLETLPQEEQPRDGEAFARRLVRHNKLTLFQANAIFKGKPHGLVLGDYMILNRIGAGGMGQVFKAMHHRMERVVALKVLSAELTSSPDAILRFQREAKAAAKLSHPNIVTAYDARADEGMHYLVMEFVDGIDLARLVAEQGPLQVDAAVNYILQAARGLEHAHAQRVVHRDIKPANLLLDKQGTIKILDMGLARLQEGAPGTNTVASGLTNTGNIMGTVDYMSPEQAFDSHSAEQTADIYSLGCTLYFLLTAHAIYDGATLMARILAHRETPVPALRKVCPAVPASIEAVFHRMVAKKVKDRYPTMTEVIAALSNPQAVTVAASPASNEGAMPGDVMRAIFDD